MTSVSREFQVFVKPAGADCNLRCRYCYYLDKISLASGKSHPLMPDEILEKYVIQHISAVTDNLIFFSWHGGEPLLAGVEFYRKAVGFQKKHRPAGTKIVNGIQTNGTLLNEEWCSFLSAEGFIIGISIDGPGDLHNHSRRSVKNGPTLANVIKGYKLLKQYGIKPEILCVVNSGNVKYPLFVYDFFKEIGAEYITFLPLVERSVGSSSDVSVNSVPSLEFGLFLSAIFDEWVEKDIGRIKIQVFEEAARTAFNQEHTLCIFRVNCGGVPVVEYNGDFYSCDHYVDKDHRLGNIREHDLAYFLDSSEQKQFGEAKLITLPRYCIECEVRAMCNGECPKNRFIISPDGKPGLNYLCAGYKYFFNHCRPFIEAIGEEWRKKQR
ncbi:MAG: anaerobic sulfatase maturase [Bacteroidetes bacterium GWE2_41_25]|nr:MAG: anaerobic sulfatase maturase [Bacteroidetes bacterium GWA2_40_15]OFX93941.1 MAG: anaerobic sulfatase maturase [Bacteroidetes bacterium GWE2_41_25]OFY00876.1 MAG: anaerobic sulfatase maturase [Bacteroidetes bacterium GWC2_40_22]HBH84828.1 anaerobic sulfatase maturase [Bacteroidales bacterium]HBQ82216.1 anaerobic sulfatase maturase [Bacteroidales bacterium]